MKSKWDSDYMFREGTSNTAVGRRVKRKLKAKVNRALDKIFQDDKN